MKVANELLEVNMLCSGSLEVAVDCFGTNRLQLFLDTVRVCDIPLSNFLQFSEINMHSYLKFPDVIDLRQSED